MMKPARNAGATHLLLKMLGWLCLFGAAWLPLTTSAAPRILLARAATVEGSELSPSRADAASLRLLVRVNGEQYDLRLRTKTTMGALATRLRSRAVAYHGELAGRAGSWVALTRIDTRWTGMWFDGANHYAIDSAGELAGISADATRREARTPMVFRLRDAVLDNASFEGDIVRPSGSAEALADLIAAELPATALATLPTKRLSVALMADALLAQRDGANTEANMLARLHIVDEIFASQVGVHIQPGTIDIFNAGNDPFTATTDSKALLDELKNFRAGSTRQRTAGLSHLMTGRDLDGSTVGIAYIQALCSSAFSASLSEARNGISFAALIAAHEIGHVFGAPHDGDTEGACGSAPPGFLMAAQLNGSQTFSSCSAEQIAPTVAAASCLAPADAADANVEAPQRVSVALDQPTDLPITVRSLGNIAVDAVNLRITLPQAITLVDASGVGATCVTSGSIVDCALGSIAAGFAREVNLRIRTSTAGNNNVQLRVMASNDALSSNNTVSVQIAADQGADMVMTASADPLSIAPGASTTATFQMENRGPAEVTDARMTLNIPAGLAITQQVPEGVVCATVTNGLSCGPVRLVANATARVTLTLRGDAAGLNTIAADTSASRPELQPTNNALQLAVTVNNPPPPQGSGGSSSTGGGGGGSVDPWWLAVCALLLTAQQRLQRRATQARAK